MKTTFVTIATFQYSAEAEIVKGKLKAEQIEVIITDQYTIDTDPFMSNAIGGVKLQVPVEVKGKAENVLKEISRYSLDDEGNEMHCPNCNSTKIDYFTTIYDMKSLLAFLFSFLLVIYPFYTRYNYRCETCKKNF